MKNTVALRKMILSAMFLAMCMVLPFITGQIPEVGSMLLPMHLPVLICGFVCGASYGALVGLIAPFLRFFLFGMPPLFPVGTAMAFEMAAYGFVCGVMYRLLPKKTAYVYVSLIAAMIAGRAVWGIAQYALLYADGGAFTFAAFLAGAFVNAWPGIVLQFVMVPGVVVVLQRAHLMEDR